jgi:hypothetical protein
MVFIPDNILNREMNMNVKNKKILTLLIMSLFFMSCANKEDNTISGSDFVFWSSEIETPNQLVIDTKQKEAFFDFDSELITPNNTADIYFFVSCGSDCFYRIMSVNSAILSKTSTKELTNCQPFLEETSEGTSVEAIIGDYYCLQTNKGNIVQLHLTSLNGSKEGIQISFDYNIQYK